MCTHIFLPASVDLDLMMAEPQLPWADHDALLLQQSHMAAQLGSPAGSRHTGSTGTHNDHVKVLRLVR